MGIACALLSGAAAGAQPTTLAGPEVGIVYDKPSQSIRRIMGVPGSAVMGEPLIGDILFASIAPTRQAAIVQNADGFQLVRFRAALEMEPLPGAWDRVAWSPDGSLAVLFSAESGQLQRVRVEAVPAQVEQPENLNLPGHTVTDLAVDRDGATIIIASQDGDTPALLQWHTSGVTGQITAIAGAGAAIFDGGGNLFVADRQNHVVAVLRSFAAAWHVVSTIDLGGSGTPAGLAVSHDRRRLYVASLAPDSIAVFDTASGEKVAEAPLAVSPSGLELLSGKPVLLVRSRVKADDPAWIVDVRFPQPVLYFVPPGKAGE
jgi:DNA-binding beta-propeller fold protein YncE